MDYILGIDAGTSNVKAVLFDEGGREVRVASREAETVNNGGNWEEQDMFLVWEKVKDCVKELTASCSRAEMSTFPGLFAHSRDSMTMAIDSLAPLVKKSWSACTPSTLAIRLRQSFRKALLSRPGA